MRSELRQHHARFRLTTHVRPTMTTLPVEAEALDRRAPTERLAVAGQLDPATRVAAIRVTRRLSSASAAPQRLVQATHRGALDKEELHRQPSRQLCLRSAGHVVRPALLVAISGPATTISSRSPSM